MLCQFHLGVGTAEAQSSLCGSWLGHAWLLSAAIAPPKEKNQTRRQDSSLDPRPDDLNSVPAPSQSCALTSTQPL